MDFKLLDTLNDLTLPILRASSLASMLNRFVDGVNEFHKIHKLGLYEIEKGRQGIEISKVAMKSLRSPQIAAAFTKSLKQGLQNVKISDAEFRRGVHRIEIEGSVFYFCLLGDMASDWKMVCLSFEPSDEPNQSLIDFMGSALQSASRWLLRLDQTQALIYRDDLTGLFNARFLEDSLEKEVRRSNRFESVFSLLFIDLDDFKKVNDQHGHLVGSDILKQLAELFKATFRDIDSVIRYGGDEFIVLLLGSTSSAARLAGERIRRVVEKHEFLVSGSDQKIKLTCSIGIASFPEHGRTKDRLIKIADECMYKSKRSGKNSVNILQNPADSDVETDQPLKS